MRIFPSQSKSRKQNLFRSFSNLLYLFRPETKEGKEGGEQEKSNEQEGTDGDKIEKELEKDKVNYALSYDI